MESPHVSTAIYFGGTVASSANITLPEGMVFKITGTTNITSIDPKIWGTQVNLVFHDILTVVNGGNLLLTSDFNTYPEHSLTLRSDGVNWVEVSRWQVSNNVDPANLPEDVTPLHHGYITSNYKAILDGIIASSGLSPLAHRTLRQLIHFIDEGPAEGFATGAYSETLPAASPFPTSFIWWVSSAKLQKIVEETVTYNSNKTINTDQWKMYDEDGTTLIATVTDTYAYSGVFELSRIRTIV